MNTRGNPVVINMAQEEVEFSALGGGAEWAGRGGAYSLSFFPVSPLHCFFM